MTIDFDGIRLEASTGRDELAEYIAGAISEYLGGTSESRYALRMRQFQVLGYRVVTRLLIQEKAYLDYVQGMSQGMVMALHEFESRSRGIAAFSESDAVKVEEKAKKLLRLATHEGTGEHEAAASSLQFAKLFSGTDLVLFARVRAQHWLGDYERMKLMFERIRREHPWLIHWTK